MTFNSKVVAGFLVLLLCALFLLVLGVLLLPGSLVKAHVCSIPFHGSLLPGVCSSTGMYLLPSDASLYEPSEVTNYYKTLNIVTSIFVVSLARRTDRRRIMDLLRGALQLEWTYFDALDKSDPLVGDILRSVARLRADSTAAFEWPETLEDEHLESLGIDTQLYGTPTFDDAAFEQLLCATEDNTIPSYVNTLTIPFHMRLSRGMIACWYSHVRLMANIVKRTSHLQEDSWDGREGVTVVFEDDIDVEWDLRERIEWMWVDLPRDWDIVMLGHCWSNESTNPPITPASPLHPSQSPKCTHGYVLSPFGAHRLLMHLTYPPFAFSRALDQAIAYLIRSGRIRSFSVVPSVVVQRRCPIDNSTVECPYSNLTDGGDSDIWLDEGRRGSLWRDSLEDSALERIWKGDVKVF